MSRAAGYTVALLVLCLASPLIANLAQDAVPVLVFVILILALMRLASRRRF